jgi:hypothetical protein
MDMTPVSPALLPSHWGLDALRCGLTKKRLQEGELKNFLSNEILWLVPSARDYAKSTAPLKENPF